MFLLAVLISVSAVASIALDVFLPSMPDMVVLFDTTHAELQSLISVYFVVQGALQLFFGPLVDRYGRFSILILGLSLFTLGSVMLLNGETVSQLMIARVVQAIGAAPTYVCVASIVNDKYTRKEASIIGGYMMTAFSIAPIVAPLIGVTSISFFGWNGPFYIMAGYGAIVTILVYFMVKETLKTPVPINFKFLRSNVVRLLTHKVYIMYCLQYGILFGVIFVFISLSSYMYIDDKGLSPSTYATLFSLGAVCFMISTFVSSKIITKYGQKTLFSLARIFGILTVILASVVLAMNIPLYGLVAVHFMSVFSLSLVMPSCRTTAVSLFGDIAGFASSLFGAITSIMVACIGWLVSAVYVGSITYVVSVLILTILSVIGTTLILNYDTFDE